MMRVRGTCQIPQPWHIWKYINTRGSFIKRKHSWTRRTLTHRFRDGVDDPREADGIVYLLLLEEEVNLRPMRLEYLNEIHPEPTLTCSLSSFCCSLLLLSSSSTLLTWMNRSFCSQTEFKYSIFNTGNKNGTDAFKYFMFLPFLFPGFPHEALWETWE